MTSYIVATRRPWNRRIYRDRLQELPGDWHLIDSKSSLTLDGIKQIDPEIIFFPHWSWMVPKGILRTYECIAFHMTDLPYGRGGSPLQNLLERGHRRTKLTAFRMTEELDGGPIYLKRDLSLDGTAEAIFVRAAELTADMIEAILHDRPEPIPQEGQVIPFQRREPEQSEIADIDTLKGLHTFIRMLDAQGYPKAFIEHQGFRFEFSRSARYDEEIRASVRITREKI